MITATNEGGGNFTPVPAGTYAARCFSMVHIGTITENVKGIDKVMNKVRISWELPTELKEFKEGEGEKPYVVSKDFTLSLFEKATLRKFLDSWRGKGLTEDEAKSFDVSRLLGVPCMLAIAHKTSAGGKLYAEVTSVSPVMKGLTVPPQINSTFVLDYDNFSFDAFNTLPEFIRKKMESSAEYKNMVNNLETSANDTPNSTDPIKNDDLPF